MLLRLTSRPATPSTRRLRAMSHANHGRQTVCVGISMKARFLKKPVSPWRAGYLTFFRNQPCAAGPEAWAERLKGHGILLSASGMSAKILIRTREAGDDIFVGLAVVGELINPVGDLSG